MGDQDFYKEEYRRNSKPYFNFQELPSSHHLTYHLLSWDNYLDIYRMFKEDTNEFVDERFKDCERLYKYMDYQMNYAWYSATRGGCDWILKKEEEPVGILHLYDLTRETAFNRNRNCTIGFAMAEPFRRQGLLCEAIQNLLVFLFIEFEMLQVLSFTRKENLPTIRLLTKLEFSPCDEDYWDDRFHYFMMKKEKFLVL